MAIEYVKRLAGPYVGEGQSTFTFGFLIFKTIDVYVGTAFSNDEASTILENGVDYTVQMNDDQSSTPGGSITLTTPLAKNQVVVIGSDIAYTQELQLTNYTRFPPEQINMALDRIVIQIQQIVEKTGRTLSVPPTSNETPEAMIERLLKAQDDASQFAEAAKQSADDASQFAKEAKGYRDTTAEYAEAAEIIVPIKEEIKAVASIKDQTEIVGNNMDAVGAVAGDLDTELRDAWVDYGVYGSGDTQRPVPVGGNIVVVATNIDNVNKVADNMDSILAIEGKIDGLDDTIKEMDRQVSLAKEYSEDAELSASSADQSSQSATLSMNLSKDWAIKMDGKVVEGEVGIDFSAKYYANEAKKSEEASTETLKNVEKTGADAVSDIGNAVQSGEAQIAQAAKETQSSVVKALETAGQEQVNLVGTKGTQTIQLVQNEGATQVTKVQTEGNKQVEAAKDAAKIAAFAYRFSTVTLLANGSAPKTQLTPSDNIKVGDHVMDGTGSIYEITAVDTENFTVGAKQADLRGPQGAQGEVGSEGKQGPKGDPGPKGEPGTTDYNELQNKPTLGGLASKSIVGKTELETYIDMGVYTNG